MNATATLVYARTPGTTRSQGISCFVVPMDSEGVSAHHMLGMGCLPLVGDRFISTTSSFPKIISWARRAADSTR